MKKFDKKINGKVFHFIRHRKRKPKKVGDNNTSEPKSSDAPETPTKPTKTGSEPDPFAEEKDKDPKSYYFIFRGLRVKKYHQKLTVLSKEFNFIKKVHAMDFIEKFACNSYRNLGKNYESRKKPIPIRAPIVYDRK